ncbi:rhodanese-like domain-containing protein [Streptomyces glaucescens]|uniref:rhodanese-like domain-containing protein n=1 Tax=Streptomyces glaucescens TaxID=1907 RepID=UPI000A37E817|nr:rhodanese-like domain-containing protein [Streptomyces glaucescens]
MLLSECLGRITPAQAHRAVEDGSALLADVREEDELRAGHAPGAILSPLSRLTEGAALPGHEDGRDLVLIRRSGHRSQQVAHLLVERGVTAVDVTGGMRALAAEGLPVRDAHGAAGTVI